jgi:hypothetical protein
MSQLKKYLNFILLTLISLILFHLCYGIHILFPSNTAWLMEAHHDWGTHYLGWEFYRNEQWTFPIGNIKSYNYPAGTNIGFTDSIPLLAIPFKLFSFLLPENFQYFGFWLLSCFWLSGYYTIKILETFEIKSKYFIVITVLFITLCPVFLYRGMHPALCAHWLILASIYNYLKTTTINNAVSVNKKQLIILVISSLVNPYLFLIIFGFSFIIPLKHFLVEKSINYIKLLLYPFLSVFSVLFLWFIVGMITFTKDKGLEVVNSYGLYGFNLNNFYNTGGYSNFLSEQKWVLPYQYEGFAYVGLGMIILFLWVIIYMILTKNLKIFTKSYFPLILLVFISTLFAITNKITFNEKIIFEYKTFFLIEKIGSIFRASGRFIWLFYYLLFFFSLIVFIKSKINKNIKTIILFFLCSLQIYDIYPLINFRKLTHGSYQLKKFDRDNWDSIVTDKSKIITYPSFQYNLVNPMDYQDISFIALKNNAVITTGYVARESGQKNLNFTDSININLTQGIINKHEIFVTNKQNISNFYPIIYNNKDVSIRFLNNYFLIYKCQRPNFSNVSDSEKTKIDSLRASVYKSMNIQKISKPKFQNNKIKYFVEKLNDYENIQIKGWAFLKTTSNNKNDSIFIVVHNNKNAYISKAQLSKRNDITETYKQGNLDNSGFQSTIFTKNIEKGVYQVSIAIKNVNNSLVFENINPKISLKIKVDTNPILINAVPKPKEKTIGNIDEITNLNHEIDIKGWSAIENIDATFSKTKIIFSNTNTIYQIEPEKNNRIDLIEKPINKNNYNNCGFILNVKKKYFKKGNYNIYILIENNNKKGLFLTGKKIVI